MVFVIIECLFLFCSRHEFLSLSQGFILLHFFHNIFFCNFDESIFKTVHFDVTLHISEISFYLTNECAKGGLISDRDEENKFFVG